MKNVNKAFRKKDAMQLVTGKPVYMDDLAPADCLIVKLYRSPHANAMVERIDTSVAKKVPGIEAIFTWEDVDQNARRYTQAGQTYPEASPYDRLVIDRHVRFVGDVVAIVVGKDEKCVEKAMKLIKVEYQVLEPVLDFHTAKDNPILVHPEDNWESLSPVGADNKRNLCAHDACGDGDIDAVLAKCDVVIDRVYHTKACQQAMMETFRTCCWMDLYGRLNILSSTQIVFHTRRNVANALHIPKSMIRVIKPRIGGGFGAKQTAVSAIYPAFVTWKTKKPCKLIFTREESQTASSPRHEMEMHVRLGATKDGIVKGIDLYTLSNTGAYGEHGPTTVGLSGHKSIPLYGKAEAFRFVSDVVYTNHMSAGAYRGYGATQGLFAVESAVNELAARLHMDPFKIREMNIVKEGDVMPAYYGAVNTSCALDRCLKKVHEMIDWDNKYPVRDLGNGKVIRVIFQQGGVVEHAGRDKHPCPLQHLFGSVRHPHRELLHDGGAGRGRRDESCFHPAVPHTAGIGGGPQVDPGARAGRAVAAHHIAVLLPLEMGQLIEPDEVESLALIICAVLGVLHGTKVDLGPAGEHPHMAGGVVLRRGKSPLVVSHALVHQITELGVGLAQDEPPIVRDVHLPQGLDHQRVTLAAACRAPVQGFRFRAAHELRLPGLGPPYDLCIHTSSTAGRSTTPHARASASAP